MYLFIESIKIEHFRPCLLDYHQKRINETFHYWKGKGRIPNLMEIASSIKIPSREVYKLRILYNLDGNFKTEIIKYSYPEIKTFELVEVPELDYRFKYADRVAITQLKKESSADEIIITQNGKITDTSFSNLVFFDSDKGWATPKTYLLNGVQRRFLLQQKLIYEADITVENLKDYSAFKLINAFLPISMKETYSMSTVGFRQ